MRRKRTIGSLLRYSERRRAQVGVADAARRGAGGKKMAGAQKRGALSIIVTHTSRGAFETLFHPWMVSECQLHVGKVGNTLRKRLAALLDCHVEWRRNTESVNSQEA